MAVVSLMTLAFNRSPHSIKVVAPISAHPAGDKHYYLKIVYNFWKEYHDDIYNTTLNYHTKLSFFIKILLFRKTKHCKISSFLRGNRYVRRKLELNSDGLAHLSQVTRWCRNLLLFRLLETKQ